MSQTYGYTVPYENFLPEVMQFVPDVADLIAVNAIRNACIEFCERTRYLQIDIPYIPLVANQASYPVVTPEGTKFVLPEVTYFNDVLLIPKSSDELASIYRMADWRQVKANPAYITRLIMPEILVVPYPIAVDPTRDYLRCRISIAPTRDSTEVDSEIYEQFLEIISFGARSRLYGTPKQAYYDKGAADQYYRMFKYGISEARQRIAKGLSRDSVKAEYQRFV
jgi:hypothetical protein